MVAEHVSMNRPKVESRPYEFLLQQEIDGLQARHLQPVIYSLHIQIEIKTGTGQIAGVCL